MSFLSGLNYKRKQTQRKLKPVGNAVARVIRNYEPAAYKVGKKTYQRVERSYRKKGAGYVAGRILGSASQSLFKR